MALFTIEEPAFIMGYPLRTAQVEYASEAGYPDLGVLVPAVDKYSLVGSYTFIETHTGNAREYHNGRARMIKATRFMSNQFIMTERLCPCDLDKCSPIPPYISEDVKECSYCCYYSEY